MSSRAKIYSYHEQLRALGLTDTCGARAWPETPIKLQRGRRDVCRIVVGGDHGEQVLFLKRNLKSYRKHTLSSLLRHGRALSAAEVEAESLRELERLGAPVSRCVAVGAEMGWFRERFSFIITESARGRSLDMLLAEGASAGDIDAAGRAIMRLVRRIHDAGVGVPSLMARHLFVEATEKGPALCMIDVDRLVRRHDAWALRVRDLAQLHLSIPLAHLGLRKRMRMLRAYADGDTTMMRRLPRLIARRSNYILQRRQRRAAAFVQGLERSISERVMSSARAARNRWKWVAHSISALGGGAGVALLWVAYALGSRDLFPLDEVEEWTELAEQVEGATTYPHTADWLLSAAGVGGMVLLISSILAARWMLAACRRVEDRRIRS